MEITRNGFAEEVAFETELADKQDFDRPRWARPDKRVPEIGQARAKAARGRMTVCSGTTSHSGEPDAGTRLRKKRGHG